MKLSAAQKKFKTTMLDHPDALENLPDDFATLFVHDDISIDQRLKVYRNNIVGSLTDAIIATFPLLEYLVGKEFLEALARCFVLENPPKQACLNTYGEGLAEFIADFAPAKDFPYLPDIARLEIAMNNAYYAHDDMALSAKDLAAIDPEELSNTTLHFRDSVHLLSSNYPLNDIRDFCLSEPDDDDTLDINTGGTCLMVHRPVLDVVITPLSDADYSMLKNLQDKALGQSIETTMQVHPDFDFQVFLEKFIRLETFLQFYTNITAEH